jgi:formate hydrogenlyase subunit 3/multisubunit Na+/H+ antiporter MnhD subunit
MGMSKIELLIYIPLAAAIVNLLVPVILRKIISGAALLASGLIVWNIFITENQVIFFFGKPFLATDQMSLFVLAFLHLLGLIILLFSFKGIDKETEKKFFIYYPMTIGFCNGAILSVHSISFLFFWGLSGLALYLFALLGTNADSPKTAKKTFIIVGGSDAFLILGFVIMRYLQPGAGWILPFYSIPLTGVASHAAFILLIIAAFAKAGGFPFHSWVPDYSKDAPVESAALLPASLDKLLGIYLLARIVVSYFVLNTLVYMILITLGALTVITAVMMAMNQHNGRKLLGYHAVSQVGYMIMGVCSGNVIAIAGGLFHLVNNTIYKSSLFLTLGTVEKKTGTNELDNLGGLGKQMPITFTMALIGALSISGIPPFNGFFSKWMIYQGLLERARDLTQFYQIWLLVCLILAVFGSALTLASFMKFIHAIYLGKKSERYAEIKEGPANQWIATGVLSALCIAFGLFGLQIPLSKFIYPAMVNSGLKIPAFLGFYDPQIIFILFGITFSLGIITYMFLNKVHYDQIYIGGMAPSEKFRVTGTEFYKEIKNMKPLKSFYEWAEKKYFDIYDLGSKITFGFSGIFQKAHPGELQVYLLYITVGTLILILITKL